MREISIKVKIYRNNLDAAISYEPDFPKLNDAKFYIPHNTTQYIPHNTTQYTPQSTTQYTPDSPISIAKGIHSPDYNNILPNYNNINKKLFGRGKTYKKGYKKRRVTKRKGKNYRKKTIKHKRVKRNTKILKTKIK